MEARTWIAGVEIANRYIQARRRSRFEQRRDRSRRYYVDRFTVFGCSFKTTLNNELWTSRRPL
jgi:hypothetical protein